MRSIIHLDADAFFASVEQAADARLRDRPVAVGGEKRGVVVSASYEARRLGVRTPVSTALARRLCPSMIIVPGDFEKYERFSRWMFSYAYDFTPNVEIGSIDEGYFDLSGVGRPAAEVADKIRQAIRQSLKISVSEGIASNKLVSQIASKFKKPGAFEFVPHGNEVRFIHPLPNIWLPGVGPGTAGRLNAAGLASIGHVARAPAELLALLVGSAADGLREYAKGVDTRPVVPQAAPAKSYGCQETFDEDTIDEGFVRKVIRCMAERLMRRVRGDDVSARTVTLRVRYNDMEEDTASESLCEPTNLESDVYGVLDRLLRRAWRRRVSVRLVGVKLSNLYPALFAQELPLGDGFGNGDAKRRLAEAVDSVRTVYGRRAVVRGYDLPEPRRSEVNSEGMRRARNVSVVREGGRFKPGLSSKKIRVSAGGKRQGWKRTAAYAPLCVHSFYSFLNSTLSIESIIELAQRNEVKAVALTDQGNLHGAVEFYRAARAVGIKPVIGAEVRWRGSPLRLYVADGDGYRNLCRLLSQMHGASGYDLSKIRAPAVSGLIAVGTNPEPAAMFGDGFYLGVQSPGRLRGGGLPRDIPAVACMPVHYGVPGDRLLFDVVQSIRTRTLLRHAHPLKRLGGDFHFRAPTEVSEIFSDYPALVERSNEIVERCSFEFPELPLQFPGFSPPDGSAPRDFLRRLVDAGFRRRYPDNPGELRGKLEEELNVIHEVGYEEYFLVVWDLLIECRRRGVEWLTRGSAADSMVCYCLGISTICPVRFNLYFRRFLNRDRMKLGKLPDIDLDFPHDRKDEVIGIIFERYGAEHAAVVGGFSTFQARSAIADVAKVLGVSEYQARRFTEYVPHTGAAAAGDAIRLRRESSELDVDEYPFSAALEIASRLDGFPRHPKMHPCGVVVSREPIRNITPTFGSSTGLPVTHFDMDSVEAAGLVKMDILAQGGLAVIRDTRDELAKRGLRVEPEALGNWDDPRVWDMISNGGARAVHHIESPAMIGLCRRCNVNNIDGLVAVVSVIRPGAANENKKTDFVRRYQGMDTVVYPHPSIEPVLRDSFGMVVYEEHVLRICDEFAGLAGGRADALRRALAKPHKPGSLQLINDVKEEFFAAARRRGYAEHVVDDVWRMLDGFRGYAFCKAHSAAYAVEAYQAAWLKRYYPLEFMTAVISNGKGFYPPLVYVLECWVLGIRILPPDVNRPGPGCISYRDCGGGLETPMGVRLDYHAGIRVPVGFVKGLTSGTLEKIISERSRAPFKSISDFYRRVLPLREEMEGLIRVGAFDGFGAKRTAQFWEFIFLTNTLVNEREPGQEWLLPPVDKARVPKVPLCEPSRNERLKWENESLGFIVSGYPLELYADVAWDTYCPISRLGEYVESTVVVCGLVIEQRIHCQATGELMKFLTLSDWTGMVETEMFASVYRSCGLATVRYPVIEVTARVEPYENGRGWSLRIIHARKPRMRK